MKKVLECEDKYNKTCFPDQISLLENVFYLSKKLSHYIVCTALHTYKRILSRKYLYKNTLLVRATLILYL